MRTLDTLINYRRHSKANRKAPTRQHLLILVALRIRNKISAILIDSDKGDNRRWTYEGPT